MIENAQNLEQATHDEAKKNLDEIKKSDLVSDDNDITNIFHGKKLELGQPIQVQGFRYIKKSII